MSVFNTDSIGTKTINFAGGEGFTESPKLEFASILLTSFLGNQFYRSQDDTIKQIKKLIPIVGYEFAAKASLFARREFGMRSVTHVVGGEIAKHVRGVTWKKNYLNQLFKRPDDMLEVVAYYKNTYGIHPLPNALKKALRENISNLSEYSLAKYRGESKSIKMIDLVNLVHPKANAQLTKLVKGELKSTGTWETKLTQAGQTGETEEEVKELKASAWKELLSENKLGYMALLKNTRNIIQQAPECEDLLCKALVNREAIKKSLCLPFRFDTAMQEVLKINPPRTVIKALMEAMDIVVENCPEFPGTTIIVIDCSGSMIGKPLDIASLFAAALFKKNPKSLLMLFSDHAQFAIANPFDSTISIANAIKSKAQSGGTNFHSIFKTATQPCDRMVILSDMQGWIGHYSPSKTFQAYKKLTKCDPKIFSFDLQGYGTLQFPERNVYALAGFSEKVFDIMKMLEEGDRNALVKKIEGVTL